ncbi:MAG: selenocysteine-specific translation elongation factor [Planctomycetota bacterium]|nr:MAG: selenocysteine-specific translation elongation factor [Planctomycetota bacterium]
MTAAISPQATAIPRVRACILGTAGHIDHGKSSLVKALTGTDPDRLPEEKARGMTIELGFARLLLPDEAGRPDALQVGIVDVPGHEKFVRTMVAGATGIDLALLVVAADDGVMPQTREHVDILSLLGVAKGLITLSKIDLVTPDRSAVVRSQLADLTSGTPLAAWPVVEVSARTGAGLDELRREITRQMSALPQRETAGVFRLAIDRVFAVHGRGTVVTGSVLSGRAAVGDALELMPPRLACKVREVQSHGASLRDVAAGQRAALNLTGLERESIARGMELATPGYLTPSRYLDASVRLIGPTRTTAGPARDKPLVSHQRVRVCMGTRDATAAAVVIGGNAIQPGKEGLVQLRFIENVVASHGQRFILRNENSQSTLGGGRIIRPASRRMRPRDTGERDALARAMSADSAARCEEAVRGDGFGPHHAASIACRAGIAPDEVPGLLEELRAAARLVALAPGREVHADVLAAVEIRALAWLKRHHVSNPLEPGIQRDRFIGWLDRRTDTGLGRIICSRLESARAITVRGPYVAHAEFRPALSAEDAALLEKLVTEISAAKFDPPAWAALATITPLSRQRARVLEEIARAEPRLVQFAPQQFISTAALDELKRVVQRLGRGRAFKLAEVRDALNASRRVVQPLLEHLDRIQFTRRVGDERVLTEKAT